MTAQSGYSHTVSLSLSVGNADKQTSMGSHALIYNYSGLQYDIASLLTHTWKATTMQDSTKNLDSGLWTGLWTGLGTTITNWFQ